MKHLLGGTNHNRATDYVELEISKKFDFEGITLAISHKYQSMAGTSKVKITGNIPAIQLKAVLLSLYDGTDVVARIKKTGNLELYVGMEDDKRYTYHFDSQLFRGRYLNKGNTTIVKNLRSNNTAEILKYIVAFFNKKNCKPNMLVFV